MAGKIFINYRRGDDPGFSGRLFDRLQEAFGSERLFMDVDDIELGVDFVAVIEDQIQQCDVLLAVIGKGWIDAKTASGARRLDTPHDFVRIEIAAALKQQKRVIPVLVGDAQMPGPEELPEELRPLARRNAARLTHERFRADVQGLIKVLQQALQDAEAIQAVAQALGGATRDEERERDDATSETQVPPPWLLQRAGPDLPEDGIQAQGGTEPQAPSGNEKAQGAATRPEEQKLDAIPGPQAPPVRMTPQARRRPPDDRLQSRRETEQQAGLGNEQALSAAARELVPAVKAEKAWLTSISRWGLAFALLIAGLAVIGFGVSICEFGSGQTLILAGAIAFTGGFALGGVAANRPVVFWPLGLGACAIGMAATGYGIPNWDFSFGNTFILAGAVVLSAGLILSGLAANRPAVFWLLGLGACAIGIAATGYGIPIRGFGLGNTLIVAGAIAISASLILIGLAANNPPLFWLFGGGACAIATAALGFGIPMREFGTGNTYIIAGAVALSTSVILVALATKHPTMLWLLGVGACAVGLAAIGFGAQEINFSLGHTFIVAGTTLVVSGLTLIHLVLNEHGRLQYRR